MNDREFPYKPYKARFRMRDVVETVLTLDRQDSTGAFFFCPFHADGENGNLHVQDAADHVTCFSGGCRFEGGDIFDFLTAYFEFNPDTAPIDCVRYLDGGRILQDEWHLSNDDLARLLRGDFKSARVKKSAVRVAKPKEFQIASAPFRVAPAQSHGVLTQPHGALAQRPAPKASSPEVDGLPPHLQPGKIVTMQPVDAPPGVSRLTYINSDRWIGMPKRDGER
jgi:hypothetical protein